MNTTKRPRIILADDHRILLDGLKNLLADDFDLVGTAMNGAELVEMARRLKPDIVITDIGMPQISGVEATEMLIQSGIVSRVIILTMQGEVRAVMQAFRAGALGYVTKNAAGTELILAIQAALAGRTFVSPYIAKDMVKSWMDAAPRQEQVPFHPPALPFTPRQIEVLRLVAQGKTMKEVGAILGISTRTAEVHKYQMMERLGIRTVPELIQTGIRSGILELSPQIHEDACVPMSR